MSAPRPGALYILQPFEREKAAEHATVARIIDPPPGLTTDAMTIASEPRGQLRLFDLRRNWRALTQRPAGHDPVVDGVRALAILWVISYHLVLFHLGSFTTEAVTVATGTWTQWTSRGDMGVDLFFVISGYLIGSILFSEYRSSGTLHVSRFYLRRFLR